jgi:amino acid transporter
VLYTAIFIIPTFLCSFSRTLDKLSRLSVPSIISTLVAGIVGMAFASIGPAPDQSISITLGPTFVNAFISITNPVFAYAGHLTFFILISEMKNPSDAMKAAYVSQVCATTFYTVFAIVSHYYLGDGVASPSFSSLPAVWQRSASQSRTS